MEHSFLKTAADVLRLFQKVFQVTCMANDSFHEGCDILFESMEPRGLIWRRRAYLGGTWMGLLRCGDQNTHLAKVVAKGVRSSPDTLQLPRVGMCRRTFGTLSKIIRLDEGMQAQCQAQRRIKARTNMETKQCSRTTQSRGSEYS